MKLRNAEAMILDAQFTIQQVLKEEVELYQKSSYKFRESLKGQHKSDLIDKLRESIDKAQDSRLFLQESLKK